MPTPKSFPPKTYVVQGGLAATQATRWLITDASRTFKVDPWPDDEYEITVWFDEAHDAARFEAFLRGEVQTELSPGIPLMFLDADQVQAITGILPDEGQLYLIRDMLAESYAGKTFERDLKQLIWHATHSEAEEADDEPDYALDGPALELAARRIILCEDVTLDGKVLAPAGTVLKIIGIEHGKLVASLLDDSLAFVLSPDEYVYEADDETA